MPRKPAIAGASPYFGCLWCADRARMVF